MKASNRYARCFRELEITKTPFMVKGKEGREKGKTAYPIKGSEGFTLSP
jgi:hypothetical protein